MVKLTFSIEEKEKTYAQHIVEIENLNSSLNENEQNLKSIIRKKSRNADPSDYDFAGLRIDSGYNFRSNQRMGIYYCCFHRNHYRKFLHLRRIKGTETAGSTCPYPFRQLCRNA